MLQRSGRGLDLLFSFHWILTGASVAFLQTIRTWNAANGQPMGVLREHTHVVECIAFSPANLVPLTPEAEKNKGKHQHAGAFIASGSRDKTVRIWETATQQCIFMLVRISHLISPLRCTGPRGSPWCATNRKGTTIGYGK